MKLRPHQEKAILLARDSIRRGLKRPIIAAPTGSGKTVIAAQMLKNCQDAGKKGWFFMDRIQLIEQTIRAFRKFGIDFGVRQANHELYNPAAPIQIASIQTIQNMVVKHKQRLPDFDLMLVDECDTQYAIIKHIMTLFNNIPAIGVTATPYSKGLGLMYNNLIVPITTRELEEQGYLCPVKYYGGAHIDTNKIRSVNPNTYKPEDIERLTDASEGVLVGDIIKNWFKYGENAQTIAFSPTQNLSKNLVDKLNKAGISAEHVDCFFTQEERDDLFKAHDAGEFKVLSCSRLLNTGYDAPSVRCIIDCFPVKSVTTFVQRVGRAKRIFEGKTHAIYLDHAGNFERFGYAEDIVPEYLHKDEKTHSERELTKDAKKEPKTRECPQCMQLMTGRQCKACGFEVRIAEIIEDDGSEMVELTGKKANKTTSKEDKERFLAGLALHAERKGYKPGWAANQYRERFGVWPNKIDKIKTGEVGDDVRGWIKHQNIKRRMKKRA